MSEKFIPEHIDPFRYAEQALSLSGAVKLSDLHRVGANLNTTEGQISVDFKFGKDEQKLVYVKGHLQAKLALQCQRCMEPFVYEIMSDFILGIVNTLDEASALPSHYEPAIAIEGQLALRELVEDELILNLPIIPRHEPEKCKMVLPLTDSEVEQVKGENPFRVLAKLRDKQ